MEKCKNPKCTCKPCACGKDGGVCTCGIDEYEKTTIENLVLDLTAARKLAEDNLNLAKYQKAEFENYKKRERAGLDSAFSEGRAYVIVNMLPVFDALTEAMKVVHGSEDRAGLEMLERKFTGILTNFGVTEIEVAAGDKFDPHIHHSIAAEKVESQTSGTVLEVWQKGYKLDGRVIRPTSVKVSE